MLDMRALYLLKLFNVFLLKIKWNTSSETIFRIKQSILHDDFPLPILRQKSTNWLYDKYGKIKICRLDYSIRSKIIKINPWMDHTFNEFLAKTCLFHNFLLFNIFQFRSIQTFFYNLEMFFIIQFNSI